MKFFDLKLPYFKIKTIPFDAMFDNTVLSAEIPTRTEFPYKKLPKTKEINKKEK